MTTKVVVIPANHQIEVEIIDGETVVQKMVLDQDIFPQDFYVYGDRHIKIRELPDPEIVQDKLL